MADSQTHSSSPVGGSIQVAATNNQAATVSHAYQATVSNFQTSLGRESVPQFPSTLERKNQFISINNLMSPPELPPYDNFQQGASMSSAAIEQRLPNVPISPPISPFKKPSNTIDPVPPMSPVIKDPILYPPTEPSSPPAVPLFNERLPRQRSETRSVVDAHIAALPKSRFKKTTPPKREEYELTLAFKSNVMERYLKDPQGWLNRERASLKADQAARLAAAGRRPAKLATILPAAMRSAQHLSHQAQPIRNNTTRIEKNSSKPRPRTARVSSSTIQVAQRTDGRAGTPAPRRSIPATPARPASSHTSITPERTVRPSREDKDFNAVPDYCPPLATLPTRANCLKVDWKGTPLDLSTDPHRHLLHPEEVHLASSLRLDCATYLTNKRRLFEHRVRCAKMPKEFRKTDAQQACKIDVNKASKLWTAFDKVGWLDINHFRQFV